MERLMRLISQTANFPAMYPRAPPIRNWMPRSFPMTARSRLLPLLMTCIRTMVSM